MIEILRNDTYSSVQEMTQKPNTDPCVICGRPCQDPKFYVRLFWGSHAVTEVEANEIIARGGAGGDLLYYPIGASCLKKHPELKPYVEDAARAQAALTAELEADDKRSASHVLADIHAANGEPSHGGKPKEQKMTRFWVSWWTLRSDIPTPFQAWRTGYKMDGTTSMCAVIDAESAEQVETAIQRIYPDAEMRFCDPKEVDYVPGDRFPEMAMKTSLGGEVDPTPVVIGVDRDTFFSLVNAVFSATYDGYKFYHVDETEIKIVATDDKKYSIGNIQDLADWLHTHERACFQRRPIIE